MAAIDLSEDEDDDVLSNVVIQRNESVMDASFLHIEDAQSTTVTNNTIRSFGAGGGIVVEGDNAGVSVTNNTLRSGKSAALQTLVDTVTDDQEPSTGVRFERNTAEAATQGVALENDSAGGIVVQQNHITSNVGDGIVVRDGNSGNALRQNHVRDNGEDGIHLESGATGNTVEQNSSFGNASADCRDDDGGNAWTKNQGETSSPPGLCTPNGG